MRGLIHLDCPSGLAGDMFLGACLDLGLPERLLADAIAALDLPGVGIEIRKARRGGIVGTRFRVLEHGRPIEGPDPEERDAHAHEQALGKGDEASQLHGGHGHGHSHDHRRHHHDAAPADGEPARDERGQPIEHRTHGHAGHGRTLREIRARIAASPLPAAVRERAALLFVRLGEAEAAVHGVALDDVHFHEVGAVDSIVDLVGAAVAWEWLAAERCTCGPVNVGSGTVATAHGRLPVPAPATARLLVGIPSYGEGRGELLTPTGAVLLAELVDEFRPLPPMIVEGAGYGLGKRELADRPNAARIVRGRAIADGASAGPEVAVIECEVDDLPGEGFGFLLERLLEEGALDAYFTPVQMKKNRPGVLITVLCRPSQRETLAGLLLLESGSLGCRCTIATRYEAERTVVTVQTEYGAVRIKRGTFGGRELGAAPEYDDCRARAREHGVSWREVYRAALVAAARTSGRGEAGT